MRPIHFRTISAGVLAFLIFAGGASAQTTSSAVLNSLEVQELIKRAAPADQARLGAHFAALAERYAADARRHKAMAQAFVGSPARRVAVNSAADHCKRLEELNTQSATTLRELAAHHEGLAVGKTSAAPRGAARFEGGAGATTPTEQELSALAAKASTPADHGALQEYFQTAAKRYTADANDHAAMARAYRGTRIAQSAAHCDRIVTLSRDSAKEATAAAAMHKGLAGVAR
jgi:hypothetical protein